jgi:hypothetical protein
LKQEIKYSQIVGKLVDPIRQNGYRFDELSRSSVSELNSIEDIKKLKREYTDLLQEFSDHENKLNDVAAPEYLVEEHSKLLICFKRFVNSTSLVVQTLDTDSEKINIDMFKKGLAEQRKASMDIAAATYKMVEKTLNYFY